VGKPSGILKCKNRAELARCGYQRLFIVVKKFERIGASIAPLILAFSPDGGEGVRRVSSTSAHLTLIAIYGFNDIR
jgi:hypothetical protein